MKPEYQVLMDNLCHHMTELVKTLRTDPNPDAVFCARQVGTALATMDMRVEEQWGVRMKPVPIVVEETIQEAVEVKPSAKPKKAK